MRIRTRKHTANKAVAREKKRLRIRKKVAGTTERPRLSVFRSARHVYAQIIDDVAGVTLASASSVSWEDGVSGGSKEAAARVGREIATLAKNKNITGIVFDRGGYIYHGRVKALADAVREAGLKF